MMPLYGIGRASMVPSSTRASSSRVPIAIAKAKKALKAMKAMKKEMESMKKQMEALKDRADGADADIRTLWRQIDALERRPLPEQS
jgi:predicted  nucleic acid-binding Zn-ribbon protein